MPSLRNDDKLGDKGEAVALEAGAGAAVVVMAGGAALPLVAGLEMGGGCVVQRDRGWVAGAVGGWAGWLADDVVVGLGGSLALEGPLAGCLIETGGAALASCASFFSFSSSRAFSLSSFCSTSNSFCKVSTGLAAPNGLGFGALGAAEVVTEGDAFGSPSDVDFSSRLAAGLGELAADNSARSRSSFSWIAFSRSVESMGFAAPKGDGLLVTTDVGGVEVPSDEVTVLAESSSLRRVGGAVGGTAGEGSGSEGAAGLALLQLLTVSAAVGSISVFLRSICGALLVLPPDALWPSSDPTGVARLGTKWPPLRGGSRSFRGSSTLATNLLPKPILSPLSPPSLSNPKPPSPRLKPRPDCVRLVRLVAVFVEGTNLDPNPILSPRSTSSRLERS